MHEQLLYVIRKYRQIRSAIPGSAESLAFESLMNNVSYRLPASAIRDPLIGFREIVRTTRKIFRKSDAIHEKTKNSTNAILGGLFREEELITDYITRSSGEEQRLYIAKDFLPQLTGRRFAFFTRWFLFSVPLCFKCIFSQKRSNVALIIREIAEAAGLLICLDQYHIKHVYDFIPYEVDSNFVYLLLYGKGIRTTKIPSPGPITTHNSIMLGDEIILSSPYQEEEAEKLHETVRAQRFIRWIPERAYTYINRYRGQNLVTPSKTIGFYSHGSWLRAEQGHSDDGMGIADAEIKLLNDLSQFIKSHPGFRITLFLHPRERKPEFDDAREKFYSRFFGNGDFQYSESGISTSLAFEKCDIAVAAFSTIVYERLFCGFKTLIGNYGIPGFPIAGSTLEKICFNRYDLLEKLLLECSVLTTDEYFSHFGLIGYHYREYPQFKSRTTHS